MNEYEEQLRAFCESEDGSNDSKYCLLLTGPWGVGKTYLVENCLPDGLSIARVSLFGIKDANTLYSTCLCTISKWYKFRKKIRKIDQNISFGFGPVSAALPVIGLFQAIISEEPKAPNRKKQKKILVIDDIERSDNALKINEILGCAELLKAAKIKVILIANTEKLAERESDLDSFKEKVVDAEIHISEPDNKIKEKLLGSDLYTIFANEDAINLTKNLRTLIFLKEIAKKYKKSVNSEMLIITLLVLLNIREKRLTKDEYIQNEIEEYRRILHYTPDTQDEQKQKQFIAAKEREIREEVKDEVEAIFLFVRKMKLLEWIDAEKLKDFLRQTHMAISTNKIENLPDFETVRSKPLQIKPLPTFWETIFYGEDPKAEFDKASTFLKEALQDTHYQVGEIIKEYFGCLRSVRYYEKVTANEFLNQCVPPLAREINKVGLSIALVPFKHMLYFDGEISSQFLTQAKIEALHEKGDFFYKELSKGSNCVNEAMIYLNQFLQNVSVETKANYCEAFGGDSVFSKMAETICDTLEGLVTRSEFESAQSFFSWLHGIFEVYANLQTIEQSLSLCLGVFKTCVALPSTKGKRIKALYQQWLDTIYTLA